MTPIPSPRGKRRPRIEIIPLIDIIFFLLATFVIVSLSMVKNRGIPVQLPASTTGGPQAAGDFITISINAAGAMFYDREPVDAAGLEARLKDALARDADPRVFIRGDERAAFGSAVSLLDELRKLGITKIAIETQPRP